MSLILNLNARLNGIIRGGVPVILARRGLLYGQRNPVAAHRAIIDAQCRDIEILVAGFPLHSHHCPARLEPAHRHGRRLGVHAYLEGRLHEVQVRGRITAVGVARLHGEPVPTIAARLEAKLLFIGAGRRHFLVFLAEVCRDVEQHFLNASVPGVGLKGNAESGLA